MIFFYNRSEANRGNAPPLKQLTTRLCKLLQKKMGDQDHSLFKEVLKRNLSLPQCNIVSIDFAHSGKWQILS